MEGDGRPRGRARGRARPAAGAAPQPQPQGQGGPRLAAAPQPAAAGQAAPRGRGGPQAGAAGQAQPARARGGPRPGAGAAPQPQAQPVPPAVASVSPASSSAGTSGAPMGRSGARAGSSDLVQQTQQLTISSRDDNGGSGNGNGNGNGNGKPVGRGSIRAGKLLEYSPMLLTRPGGRESSKKGVSGKAIKIQTNYFRLINSQKWMIYKHHVDFNPAEDRTFMRRMLMKDHAQRFGGHVFDGSSLFSFAPVCQENAPLELFSTRRSDDTKVRITIKRVGTLEEGDYQKVQIMNIIVRKCLGALKLEEIRRNYYDPKAKIMVPEFDLELWPGYQTSIGQYETDILMQAEINFKVLRTDTAYKIFRDCLSRGTDSVKSEYSLTMIGSIVLTTYNNKTYRIDDVDYNTNPKSTFPKRTREGTENVRYVDYFERVYGSKIKDLNQPMLVSRSSARAVRSGQPETIYLVPELCVMTGLTDSMRQNFQLMKACALHTAVGPADRAKRIISFANRLLSEPVARDTLNNWGMRLVPQLVEVDGRVLNPQDIHVGQKRTYSAGPQVDWTRNLRENEMFFTAELTRWLMVYPEKMEREARALFIELQKVAGFMRFTIPPPILVKLPSDRSSDYVTYLDRAINANNPQLAVCVAPNNRADRYSAIKKKCILDKPVPSQVVLSKSIKHKTFTSIATKIAIQINSKLGGAPWTVSVPISGLMVVGFDVCHDPKDKRRSFGAMVASFDNTYGRYFSVVKSHSAGEELSLNFGMNMELAVRKYKEVNGAVPKKIVVYRDGVGDGNIAYVRDQEVGSIQAALAKYYDKENPLGLIFVIVSKRINTRLFDGPRNPPPGTIVDDVVTNPFRYDFFLVSQSVRQGTVSPTHYNVIEDTANFKSDHLQQLTYKLTHMYFNWSGTVRVPAPCQYAHKLAFLTAQNVGMGHSNLNDLLYFL